MSFNGPRCGRQIAAGLSATGERGRRAAVRGSACYLSAAAAHLPIKALVGRRHPPGSALHQLGPFTSSFPSGHAASDLAFVFGAAQELPRAFVPLSACSLAVHWSLIRKRAHYPSDVLAGVRSALRWPWRCGSCGRPATSKPAHFYRPSTVAPATTAASRRRSGRNRPAEGLNSVVLGEQPCACLRRLTQLNTSARF